MSQDPRPRPHRRAIAPRRTRRPMIVVGGLAAVVAMGTLPPATALAVDDAAVELTAGGDAPTEPMDDLVVAVELDDVAMVAQSAPPPLAVPALPATGAGAGAGAQPELVAPEVAQHGAAPRPVATGATSSTRGAVATSGSLPSTGAASGPLAVLAALALAAGLALTRLARPVPSDLSA